MQQNLKGLISDVLQNLSDDLCNQSVNADALFLPFQNVGEKNGGNVLLSPISIKLALVLIFEGAQDQTALELARVMHLPVSIPATREKFNNILRSLQVNHISIYKYMEINVFKYFVYFCAYNS